MVGILRMSKRFLFAALAAAVLSTAVSAPVVADETGLASIHTWRKAGKRTCFVDHFHDGQGSNANRAKAEAEAVKNWTDFTALEYGSAWGNFKIADQKRMNCTQGAQGFVCDVSAIPCRGW